MHEKDNYLKTAELSTEQNCNMIDGVPNNTPIPPTPPELDAKPLDTIEIDAELLAQVTEVLKPYGLTPEEAAVQFFEYCADPKTQGHAIELLKIWKEEQELLERNGANAK